MTNVAVLKGGMVLSGVHDSDKCIGEYCCIHNISDHPMKEWDQVFHGGIMWRVSPEGDFYPDPDDPFAPEEPNAVECLNCHDIIASFSRHDYKGCSCGNVSVDGGRDYKRRGWAQHLRPQEAFREITEWPIRMVRNG